MTPMSGALDWLAVGDIAEERGSEDQRILGGGAARLVAHAAALGARTALVAKVGDDQAGSRINEGLERLHVDLRWLRRAPGQRTTVWHDPDGEAAGRRVERGADLALRLDELPPLSAAAALVVVSGYSLSVEPARSAALGALTTARARGAVPRYGSTPSCCGGRTPASLDACWSRRSPRPRASRSRRRTPGCCLVRLTTARRSGCWRRWARDSST